MHMQLLRTTVRLTPPLKKAADKKALELNTTFQALLERALENYLQQDSRRIAQKLIFRDRNLGAPLDELSREDLYAD